MAVVEIDATADAPLRRRMLSMLPPSADIMPIEEALMRRAAEIGGLGIKPADAVHVAAAEALRADALLTCDDRLLKAAARHFRQLGVRVCNPVTWIDEQHEEE
jgi:predicted nucleic acid-binding protein